MIFHICFRFIWVSPLVFSFNTEIIVGLETFICIMINFLKLIFNTHFLPITLENETFITDDNSESFCVFCYVFWKLLLSGCQSPSFWVFRSVLSRQRQTLGTNLWNPRDECLGKKPVLLVRKILFEKQRHHRKLLNFCCVKLFPS